MLEHQEFQSEDDSPDTSDDKPNRYQHHALDSAARGGTSINPPDPPESPPSAPPSSDDSDRWYKDRKFVLEVLGFLVLFAYTWFACLTWLQIRWTNRLTRDALQGNNSSLQQTLDRMVWQIKETHEIAKQTLTQSQQTERIANETHDLAKKTGVAANAAKSAAATADKSLHLSQRAFIITGIPEHSKDMKMANVPLFNVGHLPSGHVDVVIYEMTAETDNVHATTTDDIVERHWIETTYQSIPASPAGSIFGIQIDSPQASKDLLDAGTQRIVSVAVVTYSDGFPSDDTQRWVFCEGSSFVPETKQFAMRPCNDPEMVLNRLKITDEYPSKKYEKY